MSVEELDANEKQAFLEWRRKLARSDSKPFCTSVCVCVCVCVNFLELFTIDLVG
jgi:hypothetical protein